jgi:N-acetyl sugar amidotransferase
MKYIQKVSLYGLPDKVIHCKFCVLNNQLPFSVNESKSKKGNSKKGLLIDDDGMCAACKYTFKKEENIDWDEREKLLIDTLDRYRKNDGSYDCIVSGSGGKDSSTQAHILKYKYGMNPLTVTYSPMLYTDIGWKNLRAWIDIGGFDNFLFSPNGRVSSLLAREAFINLLHPIQPFKFGIKSLAAKMAIKHNIELVMYGEPYAEYGSEDETNTSSPSYSAEWYVNDNKDIYLAGANINDLKEKYNFSNNDLAPYMPLRSKDLNQHKLRVEFLGWYIKWNPQEIYYYASKNCGFKPDPQRTDGTYGRYTGLDDKFEWLHFYCSYVKFGIGRCRHDASQEIRTGYITREEAISLCKKYEGEIPKRYFNECIEYMGLTEDQAWDIIDKFRSPHLWEKQQDKWNRLQDLPELT